MFISNIDTALANIEIYNKIYQNKYRYNEYWKI